ncbi:SprT family zinc-dependent metalloprotease [Marinomonas ostreistagni]|nr:SprT family zinc-dependent metalloprotease [Marinomonas ostreistagni]MBM6549921.1 SprT family zinc-dependent metalloprotease [Marinomonas ostreistagni]
MKAYQGAVEQKIQQCLTQAQRYFKVTLKAPSFNFKQRGRSAGTAYLQRNEMRFNAYMLAQDPQKFIDNVVPHEVAHIVVHQIYGAKVRPHGREWTAVMEHLFNVEAARTHDFDVPKARNLYLYRCHCQAHEFTAHRHGRATRGTQYICRACGSALHFVKKK